jgi:predicted permease
MIIDGLFPVFALIVLGGLLKRLSLIHDRFMAASDRLVYFIFFPAMLFWKIGGAPSGSVIYWDFCIALICAVLCTYLLSSLCIRAFKISRFQAGTFSQSCYRFNTYIGVAIILNALGEAGVAHFGILIGFVIPTINVLAVSTLIWFSGRKIGLAERAWVTTKALVSNPLIIACISGIVYGRFIGTFPPFIDNTLRLTASAALPMALLSIGGALTFQTLKGYFKVSLLGCIIKLLIFPMIGYGFLQLFDVRGIAFQTGMIFLCLPTSPAIFVLSLQLDSDTDLASAVIVLSTVLSFVSLSVALLLFF